MKPSKKRILLLTVGGLTAGAVLLTWNWRDQKGRRADVVSFCNAEARTGTSLERNRERVEDGMKVQAHTADGRALVEQLHRSTPAAAGYVLAARATQASVPTCPAVAGYSALTARNAVQVGLDKVCREMIPVAVERAPRASRLRVVAAWAREKVNEPGVDAALGPLVDVPLDKAITDLRQLLTDHEIHICSLLEALTSPVDAHPGPNVFLRFVRVQDDREGQVATAVRSKLPAVAECFASHLARAAPAPGPPPAGALNVTFLVTGKGTLERVRVDETTLPPPVAVCASHALEAIAVGIGSAAVAGGASLDLFVVP